MKNIIPAVDRKAILDELTEETFLRHTNKGGNQLYLVTHHNAPNVMREIGRLRELTFRSVGAALTALLIAFLLGPILIQTMRDRKVGQVGPLILDQQCTPDRDPKHDEEIAASAPPDEAERDRTFEEHREQHRSRAHLRVRRISPEARNPLVQQSGVAVDPSFVFRCPSFAVPDDSSSVDLDAGLRRFGFDAFRPGQREAIEALFGQGRLICIQPTGHGKSLLYQLPAAILEGMTLVISPLLALMRDQIGQHVFPVHRLDRPTGGVLLFALDSDAAAALTLAMRAMS